MSNLNLSNAPRRLAPGTATPVTSRGPIPGQGTSPGVQAGAGNSPGASVPVPAVLTARLTSGNTVTSAVTTLEHHQQVLHHQVSPERHQPTSCPDSPIRRVSSSLKNSALDFASRFFNKCKAATFTVDGATYTIVASTPESLPSKRDEASVGAGAAGGSSGAASGNSGSGAASGASSGAAGSGSGSGTGAGAGGGAGGISSTPGQEAASPTVSELSGSGPNATINGQVARHGSLTIIRRTNSRNFNQNDGQQLASPSAATTSVTFAQTPLSEPLAERLSFRSGSNGPASAGDSRSSNQGSSSGASATTAAASAAAAAKMQPSSPNSTNYAADNLQNSSANLSQTESTDHTATHSLNALGTSSFHRGDTDMPTTSLHSYETTSNLSFNAGQWETESLPPVDTPDALNKAAGRIRSLLRRMDHETVAYEDMQRNLHYAARVLEAVFIDESRSPTSGKTRLGQIASSSVESEEEDCNGDCKNLSCSRHSHGREADQKQDNNNSNSSCSLKKVEEEKVQQEEVATTSDNQASIEGRTKGVSQAPQTHSGPTGPPATKSSSENSVSTAPAASKLQPALETVRESVLEENASKGPAPAPASTSTSTSVSASAATDPSAKAAESVTSGGSSSSGNPATVHRQRRLRTPTWARSMSTNKTYLKFDF